MAGDIKVKFQATTVTVTTTNLVAACLNSASLVSGWSGATQSNLSGASKECLDFLYSGQFTMNSGGTPSAGTINVYVVSSLNDTPTFTAVSSGALGTESATPAVFSDVTMRDSICRLLCSITTTATASRIYTFPQTGIAQLFGGVVPTHHALWVTANVNTGTTANFIATCAIYQQPIIAQYT